ncbi:MAG: hypothetical protein LUG99_00190 [Lachnospiraceae bacterium]|nr:hypothetical protein [Lachnospiraceae bacterium]
MAEGVIKELGPKSRSYYTYKDVMELVGVEKSQAYNMIRQVNTDMRSRGKMGKGWPNGKVPKWLFRKYYMLDETEI